MHNLAQTEAILNFIEEAGTLKNLPRTGWRVRGIKDCESVADHGWRVSLLAMTLADELVERGVALDVEKVMRLVLLHEIGETRLTDIPTPSSAYFGSGAKSQAEELAVNELLEPLGTLGGRYAVLWAEFERGDSLEAQLVRAVDKLEMMIQAYEYEKQGYRYSNRIWEDKRLREQLSEPAIVQDILALIIERRANLFR